MAFQIRLTDDAFEDMKSLRAFDRARVTTALEQHLTIQPTQVSKTRIKRMLEPFWCQYRLRVDDIRVYYDVDQEAYVVHVLRIMKKGQATTPEENQ